MSTVAQAAPDVSNLWDFFQAYVEQEAIKMVVRDCHREICNLVEAAIAGDETGYEYFLINMPPRTSKTRIFVAAPGWHLGEFPDSQILYGSYVDKLVHRTIGEIGGVMSHKWYQDVYGDILHTKKSDVVTTTRNGYVYGAGTMATITGYGAGAKEPAGGFIAIDDPSKPDQAVSKVESEAIKENFETTWKTRRNSDRYTPIFLIGHRLGDTDLNHYIETTYRNKAFTLKFPCFVGGRSQFPDTWSDSTEEQLKKTPTGRFVLATQMQQLDAARGGNLIKTEYFGTYTEDPDKIQWEVKVIIVDTAETAKKSNDYSVLQCWGKRAKRFYLIDQLRGLWELPQLIANAMTFRDKHHTPNDPVRKLIIEEKSAGKGLMQSLRALGIPVRGIIPLKDKVQRVEDVLTWHENRMVLLPTEERAPWVKDFVAECAAFRKDGESAHDDQVDCYAYALDELGGKISVFDAINQLQAEAAPPQG